MNSTKTEEPVTSNLTDALRTTCSKVAPVWPLESFVAVNPFLGLIAQDFGSVADRLRRVAGARMTMPTAFYLEALDRAQLTAEDIAAVLRHTGLSIPAKDFIAASREAATREAPPESSVLTVADVARAQTRVDWTKFVTDRVSAWAAAYFDGGQAEWQPARNEASIYAAWRAEAEIDRTPEVMGLARFRAIVSALPKDPLSAAARALDQLEIPPDALDLYLHRLLLRVSGWSAYAARIVWDRRLYDEAEDDTLVQFLCILLTWEVALLEALSDRGLASAWTEAKMDTGQSESPDPDLERQLILQSAYDRAAQRRLTETINDRPAERAVPTSSSRPRAQAVFCIDVRSEVYRRHLEAADAQIETLGFAGFFAFPIDFVPLGHDRGGAQCPVLLTPTAEILEGLPDATAEAKAIERRSIGQEVKRAWRAFKMGAVSCFSFVGPVGLAYLPKLLTDGFGWTRPVPLPATAGLDARAAQARDVHLEPGQHGGRPTGLSREARVDLAAGALTAMSLTRDFARLVLITGHGSTTVNNPHATGLDCGACGGRTGEANARVAAATLNDPEVRAGLRERGLEIPEDTWFLACQHDTTTDEITIFNRDAVPPSHAPDLERLAPALAQASRGARAERASRLQLGGRADVDTALLGRSRDWAQVRPEWGLAGCSAFIVAPRGRTDSLNLGGRSFLHSYDWKRDDGFGVLELIMTAPMVVASWISLQYYASTVDNELFGSGNKTLHNVVGTVGVFEGNAGDLRVGLPWQSIHDGEVLQHEPLRLSVVIEAPIDAMNRIIEKHETVRQLLDNEWLHLFALDEAGKVGHAYAGNLQWRKLGPESASPVTQVEERPTIAAAT